MKIEILNQNKKIRLCSYCGNEFKELKKIFSGIPTVKRKNGILYFKIRCCKCGYEEDISTGKISDIKVI